MNIVRPLLNLASPAGPRARLSVLVLHRVWAGPDPLYPEAMDTERFTLLCRWVKSMFNVLPLDEAVRSLREGTLPQRALSITFDDGYADNLAVAMPILRQHDLTATVFVTTGFLDGGCMWNDAVIESFRRTRQQRASLSDLLPELGPAPLDLSEPMKRRAAIEAAISAIKYLPAADRLACVTSIAEHLGVTVPDDLMLSSEGVAQLRRGGMQIGAHTVSHPILMRLAAEDVRREMQDGKRHLERLISEPVTLFAYPNGRPGEDYDAHAVALARDVGFEAAFTTVRGAAHTGTDLYQIPRFTPWDRTAKRFGLRMLSTLWSSRQGRNGPGTEPAAALGALTQASR